MSVHSSRAAEPGLPAGRADSLRWVLGSLCTGLGSLILVAPHRFSSPLLATATGLRQVWGTAALLGGVALLAAAALRPRRPLLVAAHLFAAGTLLALGAAFASSGIWIGAIAYLLLAAGAALGALPSMDEPGRPHDLFALVIAAVATVNGVVFLLVPGATRAPYFGPARALLPWLGVLFLAGGLALATAQLRRRPGRPLVVGAHLFAALPFVAFGVLVSARQQAWTAFAVNLVYATALAFLPWSGATLARLRASPLWTRLAFALAATNSLALIVTIAVATAHQEQLVLAHLARSPAALQGAAGQALLLELQRGRDVAMLLLLLLAPLAIAAGVLLARRIAQPLAELSHAVGEMNIERPVPALEESGIAELSGLAAAFTALHERLAERSAESARLAAELVERAQTLEELDRRKNEFLAMLGHELRNPVGAIANGAHLLQQLPPDDPRVQRTTALILRQVSHLIRLLEDLLDVSRITRGKVILRPGDVEPRRDRAAGGGDDTAALRPQAAAGQRRAAGGAAAAARRRSAARAGRLQPAAQRLRLHRRGRPHRRRSDERGRRGGRPRARRRRRHPQRHPAPHLRALPARAALPGPGRPRHRPHPGEELRRAPRRSRARKERRSRPRQRAEVRLPTAGPAMIVVTASS